MVEGWHDTIVP
jgi:hypothetical protein